METTTDSNEIPGFYYDPIKKKHFRIQSNSFGVQNVITSGLMKAKSHQVELETRTRAQLKNKPKMFQLALEQQFGINKNLRNKYNDQIVLNYKLNTLLNLSNNNEKIKSLSVIEDSARAASAGFTSSSVYILMNIVNAPFIYRIVRIERAVLQNSAFTNPAMNYKQLDMVGFDGDLNHEVRSDEQISYLPAYVQNGCYLVSTSQMFSSNYRRTVTYNLEVAKLSIGNDSSSCVAVEETYNKSYSYPLWCSVLNSASSKCAVGLPHCAFVDDFANGMNIQLNTNSSDAYCVGFKQAVKIYITLNFFLQVKLMNFILNKNLGRGKRGICW